MNKYTK